MSNSTKVKRVATLGDFSQRSYHLACLFVRLLRCDISYIAHYASDIAPRIRTKIQRNLINSFRAIALFATAILLTGCDRMGPSLSKKLPLETVIEREGEEKRETTSFHQLDNPDDKKDSEKPPTELYRGSGQFINGQVANKKARPVSRNGKYTLNFDDADLGEVAKVILGDTLGQNYMLSPKVAGRVTLQTTRPLTQQELIPTLEMLLRMNGAVLVNSEGLYRIEPAANALQSLGSPRLGSGGKLPVGYQVRIIPLRYIGVQEMQKILEPLLPPKSVVRADISRNLLMVAGTSSELENVVETVSVFDVDMMKGMSFGLYSMKNVEVATVIEELNKIFGEEEESPLAGMFRFVPIERLNALLVITPQPQYLDDARKWVERLDRTTAETGGSGGVYVYRVQHVEAVALAETLSEVFGGKKRKTPDATVAPGLKGKEVKGKEKVAKKPTKSKSGSSLGGDEELRFIADEENNTIVIVASAQEYEAIQRIIKDLDVTPLQVLIDATIVEVQLTDELRYGLQWFFKSDNLKAVLSSEGGTGVSTDRSENSSGDDGIDTLLKGALGTATGFSTVLAAKDIQLVLNALATDNKINVVSSPSLMVLNNQEAKINVTEEIPFRSSEFTPVDGGTANIVGSITEKEAGVILTVTPRVNAGGMVIMKIEQTVSNVAPGDPGVGGNPIISKREIASSIAINDRETIVLGGLIKDQRTRGGNGLPFLSKIPYIGPLFGSTNKKMDRTELVVLITPRVVQNSNDAREITYEFKRKLTGIFTEDSEKKKDQDSEKQPQGFRETDKEDPNYLDEFKDDEPEPEKEESPSTDEKG